jgi:hypothetical protein
MLWPTGLSRGRRRGRAWVRRADSVMNNFALLAAGRVAHLKVVMVALILATLAEWGYALVVLSEQLR